MVDVFVYVGENCVKLSEKDITTLGGLLSTVGGESRNLNTVLYWLTDEKLKYQSWEVARIRNESDNSKKVESENAVTEARKQLLDEALADLGKQLENYREKQNEVKTSKKNDNPFGVPIYSHTPRMDYW